MKRSNLIVLCGLLLVIAAVVAAKVSMQRERAMAQAAGGKPVAECDTCGFPTVARKEPTGPKPVVPPQTGRPALVEFGSGTCKECKRMAQILPGVKEEYAGRAEVVTVDVEEWAELGTEYRLRIIPTQIFFDAKGRESLRHEGYLTSEKIAEQFAALGVAEK